MQQMLYNSLHVKQYSLTLTASKNTMQNTNTNTMQVLAAELAYEQAIQNNAQVNAKLSILLQHANELITQVLAQTSAYTHEEFIGDECIEDKHCVMDANVIAQYNELIENACILAATSNKVVNIPVCN